MTSLLLTRLPSVPLTWQIWVTRRSVTPFGALVRFMTPRRTPGQRIPSLHMTVTSETTVPSDRELAVKVLAFDGLGGVKVVNCDDSCDLRVARVHSKVTTSERYGDASADELASAEAS